MTKTDPLSAWLDDLREKAETMPSGPYGVTDFDASTVPLYYPSTTDEHGNYCDLADEHHARYFAALDRETVLALVDIARYWVYCDHALERREGDTYFATLDEMVRVRENLRRLAEERVR